jgi:branched-chain amino acid transport system ATP-binding protein
MSEARPASVAVLRVEFLTGGYGDVQVIWNITFEVNPGEIVAFVGSNGAGKTTTLKTVAGLLAPSNGQIHLLGTAVHELAYHERVRRGIALIPEGRGLFQGLTVEENLRMGAYLRTRRVEIRQDLERVYAFFPRLRERRGQLAGTLSGGEQQMCAIGRGLMSRPRILLIDELSLGLAPVIVDTLIDILRQIRAEGVEILLVEQDVSTALSLADRGYVLEVGHVVLEGKSKELLESPRVQQAYLGL